MERQQNPDEKEALEPETKSGGIEVDDAIRTLGEFGRYQKCLLLLFCFPKFPVTFHTMSIVFIGATPDHVCRPLYENHEDNVTSLFHTTTSDRECQYGNNSDIPCDSWIYDTSKYTSTIVTEWDLVCDRRWMRASAQSLYMVGFLIGCLVFGDVSDRFGRKFAFIVSTLLYLIAGIATAFSPNYICFIVFRFLLGMGIAGEHNSIYVLLMEIMGPSWRATAALLTEIWWALGVLVVGALGFVIQDWRSLQLTITLPLVLFLSYYWLIPESPRWLLLKGRRKAAITILKKMEACNKTSLPEIETVFVHGEKNSSVSLIHLFKTPRIRIRSLLQMYIWFISSLTYYGVSLNTRSLAGNTFVNFCIAGAVEIPAYIISIIWLKKWGRRLPLAAVLFLSGMSMICLIPVPKDLGWMTVTLAMIGKFAITCAFGTVYIFSVELSPTIVRNISLGQMSMMARLGGIVAPYMVLLSEYNPSIPYVIYGGCAIVAGVLALRLPETHQRPLPDTIEDAENIKPSAMCKCCNFRSQDTTCLAASVPPATEAISSKPDTYM